MIDKILFFRLSIRLKMQINDRLDYLVTQNLFYCNSYGNKTFKS